MQEGGYLSPSGIVCRNECERLLQPVEFEIERSIWLPRRRYFLNQRVGKRNGCWIVEDHTGRKAPADLGGKAIAQLDTGKRVKAEILERASHVNGIGGSVAEDTCRLGANQIEYERCAFVLGGLRQQSSQPPMRCADGFARTHVDQLAQQRRQLSDPGLGTQS